MASSLTMGAGRLVAGHADRRAARSSVRPFAVKCEARCSDSAQSSLSAVVLPGLLAAALLHTSAANAGVVLKKTEGRKLFQGQSKPQEQQPQQESSGGGGFSLPSFSAPSLPSLPKFGGPSLPKLEGPSVPTPSLPGSIELEPRFLAIPVAIGAIGAIAFAWSKLDEGFGSFMNESMVKDSTTFTGYEEDEPQARGSPAGFLGLGSLYAGALPEGIGEAVTSKVAELAGSGPVLPGKNAVLGARKGGTKQVKKLATKAKKRGLFG